MADFDEAIQEAYAAAPSAQQILSTIELLHNSFAVPYRFVRAPGEYQETESDLAGVDIFGHDLTLESSAPVNPGEEVLFQSVYFGFKLSSQSDTRISGIDITIDNATRIVSKELDNIVSTRDPLTVIYREWLTTNLGVPKFILSGLTIPKVTSTVFNVTCTAEFKDLVNNQFPNYVYRPEEFRGLVA